jgi:alpha-L-fucosidase
VFFRYTEQEIKTTKAVYAMALDWPKDGYLYLGAPMATTDQTIVYLLGTENQLEWSSPPQGGINITVPSIPYNKMPCEWAWVFRLLGLNNA